MEKSPLNKIKSLFFSIFAGLDRQLGLILLGLAAIGFFTFLSSSQNTPVQIGDELRNLALSFVVMWVVSRIPPRSHRKAPVQSPVSACALEILGGFAYPGYHGIQSRPRDR